MLSEDVGALWDGPDGAVVLCKLDLVGRGFESRFEFGGKMFEDESRSSEQSGSCVVVSDSVFFSLGLQEDEISRLGYRLPEIETDEEPGCEHLPGFCDDHEWIFDPQLGQVFEICSIGKELDRIFSIVTVQREAEAGQEDPRVTFGHFQKDFPFEFEFGS